MRGLPMNVNVVRHRLPIFLGAAMSDPNAGAVGKRVAERRKAFGWSPAELARRAKMHRSHIERIEDGSFNFPRPTTLAKLAAALNCDIEELTGRTQIRRATLYETNRAYRDLIDGLEAVPPATRAEIIRHAQWQIAQSRVAGGETTSAVTPPDVELPANVAQMPERTTAKWSPEFPIEPFEFNDAGDTDYPLELHGYEMEDIEAAAGETGFDDETMGTNLLSMKEVRDNKIRTVRVRGDSMSPEYEEGWKLAIDVTQQDPSLIPDGEPVIIYRKDEGMILGWWRRDGSRVLLEKENKRYNAIELRDGDRLVGPVAFIAWRPKRRKNFREGKTS